MGTAHALIEFIGKVRIDTRTRQYSDLRVNYGITVRRYAWTITHQFARGEILIQGHSYFGGTNMSC